MVAGSVAVPATPLPHPAGMNTTKRKWLPRREWARREIAKIDADLLAPSAYEPNWRRFQNASRGRDPLHARRDRLARIVGDEFDDSPTPF